MDPDPIPEGSALWIRPHADRDADWRMAFVIFSRVNHGHCVYVMFVHDLEMFIEMSPETMEIDVKMISYVDRHGWMMMYVFALDEGSEELQKRVKVLLRKSEEKHFKPFGDVEPITKILDNGKTLLDVAIYHMKYRAVQRVLAMGGIDIDKKNQFGETALWHASYRSHLDICKLLLEHRADPNVGIRHLGFRGDDVSKILLLYGGDKEHVSISRAVEWPRVASVLVHALCNGVAPISRLPADVLRTYLLPLLV